MICGETPHTPFLDISIDREIRISAGVNCAPPPCFTLNSHRVSPMGMAFSCRGWSVLTIPPVGRRSPLLRTRGYVILWENRGGSVGRTFDSGLMFAGSSPTCGTEHFGFPPSAPRLGNQRPWYVQPCLCDWAYKRSRATYRKEKGVVSRWSVSS